MNNNYKNVCKFVYLVQRISFYFTTSYSEKKNMSNALQN